MSSGKIVEGVFALNKPTGITSAQALNHVQNSFNTSKLFKPWISDQIQARRNENQHQRHRRKQKKITVKIGHGGTLDPLATGVLIVGVGKGTKVLQSFLKCTKTYEAIILFGASTDTYDRTGKTLKTAPYDHITREMVEKALEQFRGKIMQLPPLYSALKMNGKPLYEYAREGKAIPREIEKRPVEVLNLELLEWMEGGTHEHKVTGGEAGQEEKDVAEKLWTQTREQESKDTDTVKVDLSAAEPKQTEDVAAIDSTTDSKKRKLEEVEDLVSENPKAKQKTASDPEPEMSGGLPSDGTPAKEEGPSSISTKGPPAAKLRMTVTSGFYVRSLCYDLGEALGSAAVMAELIRSRQGQFELGKNVLEYGDLLKDESVWGTDVETALDSWSKDYRPFAGSTAESNTQPGLEPKPETQEVAA